MPVYISFLDWLEDLLPEGCVRKAMFGGYAFYLQGRLILVVFESPGERTYKNKTVSYDIWDGCMFPAERDKHEEIQKIFPMLFNHPVLGKWLYLPQQTEDFEDVATRVVRMIPRRLDLFGVYPKPQKARRKKKVARRGQVGL